MYDTVFQIATVGLGVGIMIGVTFGFTGYILSQSFKMLYNYIR